MSTVLTRLPLTTTSRRRPCPGPGVCGGVAFPRLHPTNARPAKAPAISAAEIGISILLANARCYSAVAMCGRFYLTASPAEIRKLFKLEKVPELVPRYNIAPMQSTPIVIAEENARAVLMARWGLVPAWSRDLSPGAGMINAPAETLEDKP
ncbi:MAG: SOS response-associated peptidase, partial [Alphaproteobacteria bacterium]